MNRKIYILVALSLVASISFGQQISSEGQNSVKHLVYQFGQLCDLSSAGAAKQSNVRQTDRDVAIEFSNLFKAYTLDTLRAEKDSLIIINFLDPKIRLFDCYKIRNDNDTLLRREIDSCLNEKKSLEFFPKVSVNQFIDTVFKFYTQTLSDINENDIKILFEETQRVGRKRCQILVEAPLNIFRGNIDVNYSGELGINEYKYQYDIQKGDQLSFNLRFYVSYDTYKQHGRKSETNYKIDSVTLVRPVNDRPVLGTTQSRGYIEPYVDYGLSFINLNSDDPRFDNLSENNNFMISTGVNGSFYFNDRRFSKWDIGFTTGIGYKSYSSSYFLDHYIDSLEISGDNTAEQLGGAYDLYVDANSLDQRNTIKVLEVPLQFSACYNFTRKRNLGIYSRIGGLFNLVLSNDHEMKDGSVTYTGHIEKLVNGNYTDYYFNPDLPAYGFSTYTADVNKSNELLLQDYFIGGRFNLGIFGTNKTHSIGWHIGTFVDVDFTDMLDGDHVPVTSLTRGNGYMNSFYGISDKLLINNWGVEFGISIQLFKEKLIYRISN